MDWSEILRHVSGRITSVRESGATLWFRGQRCHSWPLRSTAHRFLMDVYIEGGLDILRDYDEQQRARELRRHFTSFYRDFMQKTWDLLLPEERLPWGIVFSMQHYGIPTTLLDCTTSFACALFFANDQRRPDEDAAIYLVHPERINLKNPLVGTETLVSISDETQGMATTSMTESYHPGVAIADLPPHQQPPICPMAVSPTFTNARMRAQQARFILSGDYFEPLEELLPGAIEKIKLPAATFGESMEWLALVGISSFGLFPDLDGVKRDFDEGKKQVVEIIREIKRKKQEAQFR